MTAVDVRTVDLTAVARVFRDTKKYRGIVDMIALSQTANDAINDVERARRHLERFRGLVPVRTAEGPPVEQDFEDGETLGAIFQMAIIVYARATSDGSNTRRKMKYRESLNSENFERHIRLIAVRDKAIAHADFTDHFVDGPWLNSNLVFVLDSEGSARIVYAYTRANYLQNIIDDLDTALTVAHEHISRLRGKYDNDVLEGLIPALADNEFAKVALKHPKEVRSGFFQEARIHLARDRKSPAADQN